MRTLEIAIFEEAYILLLQQAITYKQLRNIEYSLYLFISCYQLLAFIICHEII